MKKWKIISLVCFILIIGLVMVNIFVIKTPKLLSLDQQKLVDAFGWPDTFFLVMDKVKGLRYETWQYYGFGKEYMFINGKFQNMSNILKVDNMPPLTVNFKPSQFRDDLNETEIVKLVGIAPLVAQTNNEVLGLVKSLNFDYKLIANFSNGNLFSVQTFPKIKD